MKKSSSVIVPSADNLITAQEALVLVTRYLRSEYLAKMTLADAIYDGDISLYADEVWDRQGGDPSENWDVLRHGARQAATEVEIEDGLRGYGSSTWPNELRYWRWEEGLFVINLDPEGTSRPDRRFFVGASFDRSEIAKLSGGRVGIGGKKLNRETWSQFWISVVEATDGGVINWSRMKNRHQIFEAVMAVTGSEIDEGNMRDELDMLYTQVALPAQQRASETDS